MGNLRITGLMLPWFFLLACNDNNQADSLNSYTKIQSLLATSKPINSSLTTSTVNDPDEIKSWYVQDLGFIRAKNPIHDRVEALVALSQIHTAAMSYYPSAEFAVIDSSDDSGINLENLSASINSETLNLYDSLELIFKQNHIKPFKTTLEELAIPDVSKVYTATSTDNINQQEGRVSNLLRMTIESVLDAISKINPSPKEYLLASSDILRESAENIENSLSSEGHILDSNKLQFGINQIETSLNIFSISPFIVKSCSILHSLFQAYKDKTEAILDDIKSHGDKLSQTNSAEVLALSKQIRSTANELPEIVQDDCQG